MGEAKIFLLLLLQSFVVLEGFPMDRPTPTPAPPKVYINGLKVNKFITKHINTRVGEQWMDLTNPREILRSLARRQIIMGRSLFPVHQNDPPAYITLINTDPEELYHDRLHERGARHPYYTDRRYSGLQLIIALRFNEVNGEQEYFIAGSYFEDARLVLAYGIPDRGSQQLSHFERLDSPGYRGANDHIITATQTQVNSINHQMRELWRRARVLAGDRDGQSMEVLNVVDNPTLRDWFNGVLVATYRLIEVDTDAPPGPMFGPDPPVYTQGLDTNRFTVRHLNSRTDAGWTGLDDHFTILYSLIDRQLLMMGDFFPSNHGSSNQLTLINADADTLLADHDERLATWPARHTFTTNRGYGGLQLTLSRDTTSTGDVEYVVTGRPFWNARITLSSVLPYVGTERQLYDVRNVDRMGADIPDSQIIFTLTQSQFNMIRQEARRFWAAVRQLPNYRVRRRVEVIDVYGNHAIRTLYAQTRQAIYTPLATSQEVSWYRGYRINNHGERIAVTPRASTADHDAIIEQCRRNRTQRSAKTPAVHINWRTQRVTVNKVQLICEHIRPTFM